MMIGAGIFRTSLPKGFLCSGIHSGVRRYRPDLGLVLSEQDAVCAGVFTRNTYQAAPVVYSKDLVPSRRIRAIVTNSGQANAATGEQGDIDNLSMVQAVAQALGCDANQVLAASTGVIGDRLDIQKITDAIPHLVSEASTMAERFALAILTTDLMPKTVSKTVSLSQGSVQITGICKGSGMIHPNMGTMLGYLLTDAVIDETVATQLLQDSTDQSFNMISVDGETSTNDCVFLMANGASGVSLAHAADHALFQAALNEVAIVLAQSIAQDGEGASKLIQATIRGAANLDAARAWAKSLIISPLIKTAIHGESANWGRIVARLGAEGFPRHLFDACRIYFQDILVFADGSPVAFSKAELKEKMKASHITIDIHIDEGEHTVQAWGCDLSAGYVKINAEYVS